MTFFKWNFVKPSSDVESLVSHNLVLKTLEGGAARGGELRERGWGVKKRWIKWEDSSNNWTVFTLIRI